MPRKENANVTKRLATADKAMGPASRQTDMGMGPTVRRRATTVRQRGARRHDNRTDGVGIATQPRAEEALSSTEYGRDIFGIAEMAAPKGSSGWKLNEVVVMAIVTGLPLLIGFVLGRFA